MLRKLRTDPLARASLLAVVSRFGNVFVSLVTGIVVARTLGPEGKGALAYLTTAVNLVARAVCCGLESAFTRFHRVKGVPAGRAAGSVVWTVLGLGGAGAAAVLVLLHLWPGLAASVPMVLARAYFWALPAFLFLFVLGPILYGLRAEAAFGLLELTMRLVMLAATVAVVGSAWNTLLTVGLLQLAPYLAAAVVGFILLRAKVSGPLTWDASIVRAMIGAAPGVYTYNTVRYGLGYGSLLLAAQFLTVADAGLYSVASMLGESVTLLATSINMAFYPAVSAVAEPGRYARRITLAVMALCVAGGAALVFVSSWLVPRIYGAAFAPAVPLFAALLPGVVLLGGEQVLGSLFIAAGRPAPANTGVLVGLIALPLLAAWLTPTHGLYGLAIASSISQAIAAAIAAGMYWRHRASFTAPLT